jgi:hypothetical protein
VSKTGRLLAVVFLSIINGIALLVLSHRSGTLPFSWIEAGAILGLVVTGYVAYWAYQKRRLSAALVLLLSANVGIFTSVFLPLSAGTANKLYDVIGLVYVLSFVVRIVTSWRVKF